MVGLRIIVVSQDKAFGKQLVLALKVAGGSVELVERLDDVGACALLVLHAVDQVAAGAIAAIGKLTGDTRVIVVLPRANLAAVVDHMKSSPRVAGMLVADQLEMRKLSAMATRSLAGDIFGLDKLVPWGAHIHSQLVGDYDDKSACIAAVSALGEALGVRRKYRESIEQCLDEMLMNALYAAPVDEQGRQVFAEISTKTRIELHTDQKVVVQFACDGARFAIGVRDVFGTLERATVLRYLHKCLHDADQIDRKIAGAGLGLYLMTSSASEVYFHVLPGVATEAICTFDLEAPKLQLEGFGFFEEQLDDAGRVTGPPQSLPAGTSHPVERRAAPPAVEPPRAVIAVLVLAIVVTLALIVAVALR